MEITDRNKRLDIILKYLRQFEHREVPADEILNYVRSKYADYFTAAEAKSSLDILVADLHVHNDRPGLYHITLSGVVFLEDGGYAMTQEPEGMADSIEREHKAERVSKYWFYPWLIAIIGICAVYFLFYWGHKNWGWELPW